MMFYFEFRDNQNEIPKRFEIEQLSDIFYLVEIEQPCDDRRLLASGDSITELVDWALKNE